MESASGSDFGASVRRAGAASSDEANDFGGAASSDEASDFEVRPAASRKKPAAAKALAAPAAKKPAAKKAAAPSSNVPKATSRKAPAAKRKPLTASGENSVNTNNAPAAAGKGPGARSDDKTIEEIYQKKTQLEHVLLRPDTYIGSIEAIQNYMWVWEDDHLVNRAISYVPGLYKIFDEILVNAADNKQRDPSMDTLRANIDRENNVISVYNNGRGIPVEMHKEEGVYVPELIFGHLLTSSNYDDDQKKVVGGRNGYGAKLCNIFSTRFVVETADRSSGKKFRQVFTKNMTEKTEPEITANTRNEEYTKITFQPDLAKFGMTAIDDDLESLLKKRVYDMAGVVKDVKVFLNDERLKIKNFKQYVELYLASPSSTVAAAGATPQLVHEIVNDRWEILFTLSDGQFQQVSFANSICTSKGGTHVAYVADQLVTKIVEAVKRKNKAAPVKPFQVKNHLRLFINCLIENPAFDSQTKENMTLRQSAFGSKCTVSDEFIKRVLKSGVVENVLNWAKFREDQLLKKTDGSKRSRITGITKLEDANNAGTRLGSRCTLILTEGDSAKALAVSGLSVVGRDYYGVFPLRGKLLNVREASASQILANQEIQHVKQILGLQHNKSYESTESLRYGHMMIMTDQDHDGSHIKGLIINFLDRFYPSLLKVPGFLVEFITPIVRCTKRGGTNARPKVINFFTIPEYEQWKQANDDGKGWDIKYYKGLGTSTAADAKAYFSDMDRHLKRFAPTEDGDRELIDMAFSKKKADERKEWLRHFVPGTFMDHSVEAIKYSDFINRELILFSMADNARSIPSMVDGLKPGQRKVIFSCIKRKLSKEIKVAQLAGYVSEHSAYHHGEQSLTSTIVNLAQSFVGANNINLLLPLGQFGTRLQGGKDAASARYIFTNMSPLARRILHPDDDQLLKYLNEDGQQIEPEWYMPVLPLCLVNGADGIGTGWSTHIPNYNPSDITRVLKQMMNGEEPDVIKPWYRGFKGTIEMEGRDKLRMTGIINKINETTVEITELPVRCWTQSYKEQLESWVVGSERTAAAAADKEATKKPSVTFIKDYKEYHTDTAVHFLVTMSEENMKKAEEEGLEKRFKLTTTINLSNMVAFDIEGRIRKYTSPEEIIAEFYPVRLRYYQRRKDYLADCLSEEWTRLDNRARFVREVIAGEIVINNRRRDDLLEDLRSRKYKPMGSKEKEKDAEDAEGVESEGRKTSTSSRSGYDYLLGMPIWSLTKEKAEALEQERKAKEQELNALLQLTPNDMWCADLDAFMEDWEKVLAQDREADKPAARAAASSNKAPLKRAAKKKVIVDLDTKMVDVPENNEGGDFVEEKPKKPTRKPRTTATTTTTAPKQDVPHARRTKAKDKSDEETESSLSAKMDRLQLKQQRQNEMPVGGRRKQSSKTKGSDSDFGGGGDLDDDEEEEAASPLPAARSRSSRAAATKKPVYIEISDENESDFEP